MCGVFGIVTREVSPELLERAKLSLAHRGPDDTGSAVMQCKSAEPCQVGLAHTRLSIIDLSSSGHQPMRDPVTGNLIIFNGEIYNFRLLRRELEAAGGEFRTQSDTEVILAAYRNWGDDCLRRLRGMFAFALWDDAQQRLLLARDPMGIKPLYYCQSGGTFLFASEIRSLLQTGLVPRAIDATGALSYLAFGSVYEPWTIVDGVRAVPPGHMLTLRRGAVEIAEYWSLSHNIVASCDGRSEEQRGDPGPARLMTILREAVLSHLVSDVPVGVFLSGGIDSSSLVAVLSQNGVRASTFSLVFEEEEFNEARYSREVARRFGTDHHEIHVSIEDTRAILPQALGAMDQPTVDGINTYLVSAKARAAGVKVALTGLGADELFAGYSNFRRVPRMERVSEGLKKLPHLARRPLVASAVLVARGSDQKRKLATLAGGKDPTHPYFLARAVFGREEQHALLPARGYDDAAQALHQSLGESIAATASLDAVNRVSYLESYWYMRNTLLRDSDFMSMAHGLELRVPFLDRDLVEACFRIPGKEKVGGRVPKHLLLASLGVELPVEIVKRPKRGFTLPFERWLRGELKAVMEKCLLHGDTDRSPLSRCAVRDIWNRFLARETSWSRPWSLFVLQHWCEKNL